MTRHWVDEDHLQFIKRDGRVLVYKAADVQAWLEAWHKKAIQENDCDAEPIIAELLADLAREE